MFKSMPKNDYLNDLHSRLRHNRQVVQTEFLPLPQQERGWQPAPQEWSIDQCFEHLILSFNTFLPGILPSLDKPQRPNFDGLFRPTWQARMLMDRLWDPQKKYPTQNQYKPQESAIPHVLTTYLKQLDRLEALLQQAYDADLQDTTWWHKKYLIRFNLGDHLLVFVAHDELHIDQARRAHKAYKHHAAHVTTNKKPGFP